jgi:hypothetical protein
MLFGPWVRRSSGGRLQVFLHATIDDASRLIPHAQFYASQGLDAALDCLRHAVAARGVPTRLYIDNAKIYRSPQLARIAASVGTLIVHSRPYQPEGRGKIERFFRTVREQFLANVAPQPLLSLEEFNDRLWIWIETVYHRSAHSALGTTPLARWQRDIEQIRQLPPATDLRRLFFQRIGSTFLSGHGVWETREILFPYSVASDRGRYLQESETAHLRGPSYDHKTPEVAKRSHFQCSPKTSPNLLIVILESRYSVGTKRSGTCSLQPGVFGSGLLENRDVGVGVFPEG